MNIVDVDHRFIRSLEEKALVDKHIAYLNSPLKRAIDIVGALVGITLGFPIFGIAAIVAVLIDGVPPIFRQERFGFGGKPFTMMKLRTLAIIETRDTVNVMNMQVKPQYCTTRTGQFWRTMSIDEIIQFWLVLKGDMSLIGHRAMPVYYIPHLQEMAGMDQAKVHHYLRVVSTYKPCMSSLSSVNGRGDLTMQQKMAFDLAYVERASLGYDLQLLVLTVIAVITRRGAK